MDAVPGRDNTAEQSEEGRARECLALLPGFTLERAKTAQLTRLVGMTNRVYRVESGGERLCLRIPGDGKAARIDRRAEAVNARLAAAAGIAPEVLHFGADGLMLTRFIDDAIPLRPERLKANAGAIERAAKAFRRLHAIEMPFAGTFRAFAKIDEYAAALAVLGIALSDAEQGLIRGAHAIGRALSAKPVPFAPSHCDPTGRNVLDTGERVWLVDWEYSGMNDPMWDLAYFSIESLLDAADEAALLAAYVGRPAGNAEAARMAVWKPVAEILAALWALIQAAEGNVRGDFAAYAKATLASATTRMQSEAFSQNLAACGGADTPAPRRVR